LAAAIRLAAAGYRVDLFEKQSGPGGKAFTEEIGAYRFDTGPSLFTLREVFADLFSAAGRSIGDYIELRPLDEICRYFWRDGSRVRSFADPSRTAEGFALQFGEPADNLHRFLAYSRRIHEITAHLFLERSLHEWSTYASYAFVRSLVALPRIDAFRTMHAANASFFRDPHLHQFFDRYATYNGSNPYRTPATLNIIPHVEYGIGAWAVVGGIYAVPRALERLARDVGVSLHYGSRVEHIETEGVPGALGRATGRRARVTGVVVDGETVPADVVVSNADVTPTYRDLLGDTRAPLYRRYRSLEPSSSGVVFYWGIGRAFPQLGLHNIFFSDDYQREFRQIFDERELPDDPTIYVNITSKNGGESDAPEGKENWFVLVNAPHDDGRSWDAAVQRLRETIIERVSRELGEPLERHIEVESRLLPADIEARTDSFGGSLYGISSNSRLAAFLRHPNRSRRYSGLYFVGGSAHPGGGMPLVALGGRLVADLVARHAP
jgi:phytoene desaturase